MEIIEIGRHSFCAKLCTDKRPESKRELRSLAEKLFREQGVEISENAEITAYSNGISLLVFVSENSDFASSRLLSVLSS